MSEPISKLAIEADGGEIDAEVWLKRHYNADVMGAAPPIVQLRIRGLPFLVREGIEGYDMRVVMVSPSRQIRSARSTP